MPGYATHWATQCESSPPVPDDPIPMENNCTEMWKSFEIVMKDDLWSRARLKDDWTGRQMTPFLYIKKIVGIISTLLNYCCSEHAGGPKKVLLVAGPKDSGKSTGIFYTVFAAKKLNYTTISIDLLGAVKEADSTKVLSLFACEVVEFISENTDFSTMCCMYQGTIN